MKQDITLQDNILKALVLDENVFHSVTSIMSITKTEEVYRRKVAYHLMLMEDMNLIVKSVSSALDEYRVSATGQERFAWLEKNSANVA